MMMPSNDAAEDPPGLLYTMNIPLVSSRVTHASRRLAGTLAKSCHQESELAFSWFRIVRTTRTTMRRVTATSDVPLGTFVCPFGFDYDPMKQLLLINIDSDPDTIYTAFEPQAFDDDVNGTGLLVLAYRVNGKIDCYKAPQLRIDHKDFGMISKGLGTVQDTPRLNDSVFVIDENNGVSLDICFPDLEGRMIELEIREQAPAWCRPRRPFSLLAPLGSATEEPTSLPLIFLYGFYFCRQSSHIRVAVDGVRHHPDLLPVWVDGCPASMVRYSSDPFCVVWNHVRHNGPMELMNVPKDGVVIQQQGHVSTIYTFTTHGLLALERIKLDNGRHELSLDFDPPWPNLIDCVQDHVTGRFSLAADPSSGRVTGRYELHRDGRAWNMVLRPRGWQPREHKWSVLLTYFVQPLFRKWPRTYAYDAQLMRPDDQAWTLEAAWSRTEKPHNILD